MAENPALIIYNMETKLLKEAIKELQKGSDLDLVQWKLLKLRQIGGFKKLTAKIIEDDINEAINIARQSIKEAGYDSAKIIDNTLYGNLPLNSDPKIKAILLSYETKTRDEMYKLGAKLMVGLENMYIDIIEQSTAEVLTGQTTLRNAIRQTAKKWAKDGIQAVKDSAGRQWTNEAYTQMVIRSGTRNAVTNIQLERLEQYDHDLIEISSHIGARPLCAIYQGTVISRTGKTQGYIALQNTSYGQKAGLFGINCGHRIYPYIQGTKKTYNQYNKDLNEKVYAESQKQRYYERQIRYNKRLQSVYSEDRKEQIKEYENKIKSMGRTRRTGREEIY